MKNNTNLKQVPPPDADKLSWHDIDRLARGIAIDLGEEHRASKALMLLFHEIATHPFDHPYVETIANLASEQLYGASSDARAAFKLHVAGERGKIVGAGA
jgi:hypothetical protein